MKVVEWQPIETAPTDGTVILLTDGERLAAGAREHEIETDLMYRGYVDGKITDAFADRIPNPNAGKRNEWWGIFGCSGFGRDVDVADHDGPLYFKPTHWMPCPAPPTTKGAMQCLQPTT